MQEEILQFHLQKVWTLVDLPRGFEDPDYPDKVYKVEKAFYGLHQDPRAWYKTLAKYLLDNGFHRGKIDQTLFIKRQKEDILLVQVYVDDIIFGSTKKELWLQVKQKSDGIFISQDKYVDEILRKFKNADVKPASTPMDKERICSKIKMVISVLVMNRGMSLLVCM
nr:putative ribonuclease H-like domain-containing protein [Tanacetum cinerariifolium]